MEQDKDFKIEKFKELIGQTIQGLDYADADEGFILTMNSGLKFVVLFSGCEGTMQIL